MRRGRRRRRVCGLAQPSGRGAGPASPTGDRSRRRHGPHARAQAEPAGCRRQHERRDDRNRVLRDRVHRERGRHHHPNAPAARASRDDDPPRTAPERGADPDQKPHERPRVETREVVETRDERGVADAIGQAGEQRVDVAVERWPTSGRRPDRPGRRSNGRSATPTPRVSARPAWRCTAPRERTGSARHRSRRQTPARPAARRCRAGSRPSYGPARTGAREAGARCPSRPRARRSRVRADRLARDAAEVAVVVVPAPRPVGEHGQVVMHPRALPTRRTSEVDPARPVRLVREQLSRHRPRQLVGGLAVVGLDEVALRATNVRKRSDADPPRTTVKSSARAALTPASATSGRIAATGEGDARPRRRGRRPRGGGGAAQARAAAAPGRRCARARARQRPDRGPPRAPSSGARRHASAGARRARRWPRRTRRSPVRGTAGHSPGMRAARRPSSATRPGRTGARRRTRRRPRARTARRGRPRSRRGRPRAEAR